MSFLHDLRFAFRMLRKSPATSAVAILTLGLGIGANAALFAIVDGVLLRPLPLPESERLVFLTRLDTAPPEGDVSLPDGEDLRAESASFESLALIQPAWSFDLLGDDGPTRLQGVAAEAELFDVLDAPPVLGRYFTAEEDRLGGERVAVIATGLWQRRFGGDPGVIGRAIILSDNPHVVIGVAPPQLDALGSGVDLWVPLAVEMPWAVANRGTNALEALARLRPGVTLEAARTETMAITTRLVEAYPNTNRGKVLEPIPLLDLRVGAVRPALLLLLGALGLVFLIACLNLASLLLARAIARRHEFATRRAFGAPGRRIVGQLVTEGLLIAGLGFGLGVLLAVWGKDLLLALAPASLPRAGDISIDLGVFLFAAAVALVSGLTLGLVPALVTIRRDPARSLAAGGRGASLDRGGQRLISALVIAEVALACVLLIGCGLLLRSFDRLRDVELGFATGGVLLADVVLPESRYSEREAQSAAFARIVEAISVLPGVEAAASVIGAPLEPTGGVGSRLEIAGRPEVPASEQPGARVRPVHGEHFAALRQPLLEGRTFTSRDGPDAPPVAIVNLRMAEKLWPGESPLGARVRLSGWGDDQPWLTVVGVVADVKSTTLDQPDSPALYMPYLQRMATWQRWGTLVVRTEGPPTALVEPLRAAVATVDPALPVAGVQTLEDRLAGALAQARFTTRTLGVFALVALILAMLGIYGLLAFALEQRRREIGIKKVLGARPADLVRSIVAHSLRLALFGLGLGLLGALLLGDTAAALLYEIAPRDLPSYLLATIAILAAALLAGYLPAARASRLDPMTTLRQE